MMSMSFLFGIQTTIVVLTLLGYSVVGIDRAFKNPAIVFMFVLYLVHGLVPYFNFLAGYERYAAYEETDWVIAGWIATGFTALTMLFVILFSAGVRKREPDSTAKEVLLTGYIIKASFVVAIPALFSIAYLQANLRGFGVSNFLVDRIAFGYGKAGYLLLAGTILVPAAFTFAAAMLSTGKLRRRAIWASAFFMALTIIHFWSLAQRNALAIMIAILSFVAFTTVRRIKLRQLGLLGTGAAMLALVFALAGEQRKATVLGSQLEIDGSTILNGLNGGFGNHEFVAYLNKYPEDWENLNGATFAAAFVFYVPRSIWAGKPTGAGPFLKNTVDPGSYEVGAEGNSSLTTGIVVETIMNFGNWGLVPVAFLLAVILSILRARIAAAAHAEQFAILAILSTMFAYQLVYQEFFGLISRNLTLLFFATILYGAIRIKRQTLAQKALPRGRASAGVQHPA